MKRLTLFLVLIAGSLAATPAAAQKDGFELRGLRLGMDPGAFVTAAAANGWGIPSYTTADGRELFRAIDYLGLPRLDSLTDEVYVESTGLMLGCPRPGESTCAPVESIKARFRFGMLSAFELTTPNGQEKIFRPFALGAVEEVAPKLGSLERDAEGVRTFFRSYTLEKTKPFVNVPIVTWEVAGDAAPIVARLYAVRLTTRFDQAREEKRGVYTPWGNCRLAVALDAPDLEARWDAHKADLKQRAAK